MIIKKGIKMFPRFFYFICGKRMCCMHERERERVDRWLFFVNKRFLVPFGKGIIQSGRENRVKTEHQESGVEEMKANAGVWQTAPRIGEISVSAPTPNPLKPHRACHARCIVVLSPAISLSVSQQHSPLSGITCPPT